MNGSSGVTTPTSPGVTTPTSSINGNATTPGVDTTSTLRSGPAYTTPAQPGVTTTTGAAISPNGGTTQTGATAGTTTGSYPGLNGVPGSGIGAGTNGAPVVR